MNRSRDKSLVDVQTGRNIEAERVIAEQESGKPLGKRYSRRAIMEMRQRLATTGVATKKEPYPMRHKMAQHGGPQRPGDAAVPKEQKRFDLVLKHTLSRNRGPTTNQIDSVNPIPHPPLPVG